MIVGAVRTGGVRPHSTSWLAVVAAATAPILQLDGVVLGRQGELLDQPELRPHEVPDDVAWVLT